MTEIRSVLDDVFKVPEEEVRTFSEVMRTPVAGSEAPLKKNLLDKIKSGVPDKVEATAKFSILSNGYITIESGFDGSDYVWHIEPYGNRQWKVSLDRAIYAAIQVLNEVIPKSTTVNVFLPFAEWENQVLTFKAINLESVWNVSSDDLEELIKKLLEVLRALT